MTSPHARRSQSRRTRRLLVPVGLLAVVAALLPTTGAAAGPPPDPATTIVVSGIESTVLDTVTGLPVETPVTDGSPQGPDGGAVDLIATAPSTFAVSVELRDVNGDLAPFSSTKGTPLRIAVTQGTSRLSGTLTATVPAGKSGVVFSGLALGTAANDVVLTVSASSSKVALAPDSSDPFTVLRDPQLRTVTGPSPAQSVSRAGVDVPCEATVAVATCADLVLPGGVAGDVFFADGTCASVLPTGPLCPNGRDLLMVLAEFELPRSAPATIIHKCDKSRCGGGGVPSKELYVNLDASGPLVPAPACATKGVVNADADFCVDYAQSKRTGAGDVHLYLLLTRDARMSAP